MTGGGESVNGQPFCTSHYAFMLTDYYLVYALSGQQTDLGSGSLTFAPLYQCPYALPFGILNGEGTLSCDSTGRHTLKLAFGELSLPPGGLVISGDAYLAAVNLTSGESITW